MKTLITVLNIILVSFLCAPGVYSQPNNNEPKTKYAFVKQKNFSESYNIQKGDAVYITNEFGKITVHTWNQDVVKVTVNAEVTCDKEQWATTLFDRVSFDYGKKDRTVSFRTVITGNMSNGQWITDKESYTNTIAIDYDVYLPASAELSINNQFGDIIVPDFDGKLAIKCSFGKLVAGKLMQPALDLDFGTASIKELGSGKASFSFTSDPVVVDQVSGALTLNASNCGKSGITIGLGERLHHLDVTAEYSDIQAVVGNKPGYKADLNLSNGTVTNKTALVVKETPGNDDNMMYLLNPGGTDKDINIKSSYGNIVLTNTQLPMPKGEIRHGGVSRGPSSGGSAGSGSKSSGTGSRSSGSRSSGSGSGSKGASSGSGGGRSSGGGGANASGSEINETVSGKEIVLYQLDIKNNL